jgi:two-component system chemotaxis response regulator CheY
MLLASDPFALADIPILVVDDGWGSMDIVVKTLQMLRFGNIDKATSGAAALKLAVKRRYRLAISELTLSDGSGLEVLRRIRLFHPLDAPGLMVVTSHRETSLVVAAKKAGVTGYLVKPFAVASLKKRVEALLGQTIDEPLPEPLVPGAPVIMLD